MKKSMCCLWLSSWSILVAYVCCQPPPLREIEYVAIWVHSPTGLWPHLPHILESAQHVRQTLIVDAATRAPLMAKLEGTSSKLFVELDDDVFARALATSFVDKPVVERMRQHYVAIRARNHLTLAAMQSDILRMVALSATKHPMIYHDADIRFDSGRRQTHAPPPENSKSGGWKFGVIGVHPDHPHTKYNGADLFAYYDLTMVRTLSRTEFLENKIILNNDLIENIDPAGGEGSKLGGRVLRDMVAALDKLTAYTVRDPNGNPRMALFDAITLPNPPSEFHISMELNADDHRAITNLKSHEAPEFFKVTPKILGTLAVSMVCLKSLGIHQKTLFFQNFYQSQITDPTHKRYALGWTPIIGVLRLQGTVASVREFMAATACDVTALGVTTRQNIASWGGGDPGTGRQLDIPTVFRTSGGASISDDEDNDLPKSTKFDDSDDKLSDLEGGVSDEDENDIKIQDERRRVGGLCSSASHRVKRSAGRVSNLLCVTDDSRYSWKNDKMRFKSQSGEDYVATPDFASRRVTIQVSDQVTIYVDKPSITGLVASAYADTYLTELQSAVQPEFIRHMVRLQSRLCKLQPADVVIAIKKRARHYWQALFNAGSPRANKPTRDQQKAIKGWFVVAALSQASSYGSQNANPVNTVFTIVDSVEMTSQILRIPKQFSALRGINSVFRAVARSPVLNALGHIGAVYGIATLVVDAATGNLTVRTPEDVYWISRAVTGAILPFIPILSKAMAPLLLVDLSLILRSHLRSGTLALHEAWKHLNLQSAAVRGEVFASGFVMKPNERINRAIVIKSNLDELVQRLIGTLKGSHNLRGVVMGIHKINALGAWEVVGDGETVRGSFSVRCDRKSTASTYSFSLSTGVDVHINATRLFVTPKATHEVFIGNKNGHARCESYIRDTCNRDTLSYFRKIALLNEARYADEILSRCPLLSEKELSSDWCQALRELENDKVARTKINPNDQNDGSEFLLYPSWSPTHDKLIQVYDFPRGYTSEAADACVAMNYPKMGYKMCPLSGTVLQRCTKITSFLPISQKSSGHIIALMKRQWAIDSYVLYSITGTTPGINVIAHPNHPSLFSVTGDVPFGLLMGAAQESNSFIVAETGALPRKVVGGLTSKDSLTVLSKGPGGHVRIQLEDFNRNPIAEKMSFDPTMSNYWTFTTIIGTLFLTLNMKTVDVEFVSMAHIDNATVLMGPNVAYLETGAYAVVVVHSMFVEATIKLGRASTIVIQEPTSRVKLVVKNDEHPLTIGAASVCSVVVFGATTGQALTLLKDSTGIQIHKFNNTCMVLRHSRTSDMKECI